MRNKDINTLLRETPVWRVKSCSPSGPVSTEFFETLEEAQSYIRDIVEDIMKNDRIPMIPIFTIDCID